MKVKTNPYTERINTALNIRKLTQFIKEAQYAIAKE